MNLWGIWLVAMVAGGPRVDYPGGPIVLGGHSQSVQPGAAERRRVGALEPFSLSARPVSNREFARFLSEGHADYFDPRSLILPGDGGFEPLAGHASEPVVYANWYAARAYAAWAGMRLPLAAELELVARGRSAGARVPVRAGEAAQVPEGTLMPGGGEGWTAASDPDPLAYRPLPVPSGGMHFPAGIWEWTQDTVGEPSDTEPKQWVVVKGGGRADPVTNHETWISGARPATLRTSDLGFRVATSVSGP